MTWERVVSGPGLAAIDEFLGGQGRTPEQVAAGALADSGSREARAMEIFLAAYGAFAGDMALVQQTLALEKKPALSPIPQSTEYRWNVERPGKDVL